MDKINKFKPKSSVFTRVGRQMMSLPTGTERRRKKWNRQVEEEAEKIYNRLEDRYTGSTPEEIDKELGTKQTWIDEAKKRNIYPQDRTKKINIADKEALDKFIKNKGWFQTGDGRRRKKKKGKKKKDPVKEVYKKFPFLAGIKKEIKKKKKKK